MGQDGPHFEGADTGAFARRGRSWVVCSCCVCLGLRGHRQLGGACPRGLGSWPSRGWGPPEGLCSPVAANGLSGVQPFLLSKWQTVPRGRGDVWV